MADSMSFVDGFLSHWPRDRTRYSESGDCSLILVADGDVVKLLCRRSERGGDRAEVGKSLLKSRAAHFVAVHEQAHHLAHEIVFAIHRPRHDGLVALGFECEVNRGCAFHRSFPVHSVTDEFAGFALNDGAASSAHVTVAIPTALGTDAGLRAAVGILDVAVKLHKRIPN